jgi:hypothetical protein
VKIPWYWILSVSLFLATTLVLNGLQTSFWFLAVGSFPPPFFWLIVLVYISVTRPMWEATLMTYLLCFINSAFTVLPFEAMLVFSLALMVTLVLVRERVFWGGPTYFMLMVAAATMAAPILHWIASRWFDKNPVFIPQIFDWLISCLLTIIFSLPLYRLFQWYDAVAAQDSSRESRIGPR